MRCSLAPFKLRRGRGGRIRRKTRSVEKDTGLKSGEGVFVVEDLGARSLLSTRFSDNCRLLISSQQLTNTAIFRSAFDRPVQGDNEISMAGEFIENVSADQTASAKKTMHPLSACQQP